MTTQQTQPIDLYFFPTPNGKKISIMLEELAVPYHIHKIHIGEGDQFKPDFLKVSPNNKIPAIVDPEGPDGKSIALFESGAILLYLARKFDTFYARDARAQTHIEQWLMWQMGGFGPMLGQANFFTHFCEEKVPVGIKRYVEEANRLYSVLNQHLADKAFVAGDYSIADMAIYPWSFYPWSLNPQVETINIDDYAHIKAWQERMIARPGVARGMAVSVD